jgi:hypothetical protein
MPIITHPRPTHRACAWCANEYPIAQRPGRPRLYCNHTCRQRAYEHRHGFTHQRTTRPLPGQTPGETWTGTGYERSYTGLFPGNGRVHAMRTSVRPERHRRETLCGLLAPPLPGHHFNTGHQRACATCTTITTTNPLRYGINPSNELATIEHSSTKPANTASTPPTPSTGSPPTTPSPRDSVPSLEAWLLN